MRGRRLESRDLYLQRRDVRPDVRELGVESNDGREHRACQGGAKAPVIDDAGRLLGATARHD